MSKGHWVFFIIGAAMILGQDDLFMKWLGLCWILAAIAIERAGREDAP